jgi:ubiquinone/menaquinone biosynthesis C-methylase UbiE
MISQRRVVIITALYNDIGSGYDTTRKADPEISRRLLNHLQIFDGAPVIDLACGTGNYTIALSNSGLNISGVDIAETMINEAKRKSKTVSWYTADISSLPFSNSHFNGAVCTLAIHHFHDLYDSFKEVNRILNVGSRFVILTSSPEQMKNYWLNEYFPDMMDASMKQMPSINDVSQALLQNKFRIIGCETFMIQPNLEDFFLYSGKYTPEIYLKPEVRRGISSFASLAKNEEIDSGLQKLKSDIELGKFYERTSTYDSRSGDYLYVVAEKSESFV